MLLYENTIIAFFVNRLCLFMATSTYLHWLVVKRVLRYLKGIHAHGFLLTKPYQLDLTYIDIDWTSFQDNIKSIRG